MTAVRDTELEPVIVAPADCVIFALPCKFTLTAETAPTTSRLLLSALTCKLPRDDELALRVTGVPAVSVIEMLLEAEVVKEVASVCDI